MRYQIALVAVLLFAPPALAEGMPTAEQVRSLQDHVGKYLDDAAYFHYTEASPEVLQSGRASFWYTSAPLPAAVAEVDPQWILNMLADGVVKRIGVHPEVKWIPRGPVGEDPERGYGGGYMAMLFGVPIPGWEIGVLMDSERRYTNVKVSFWKPLHVEETRVVMSTPRVTYNKVMSVLRADNPGRPLEWRQGMFDVTWREAMDAMVYGPDKIVMATQIHPTYPYIVWTTQAADNYYEINPFTGGIVTKRPPKRGCTSWSGERLNRIAKDRCALTPGCVWNGE